MKHKLIGMVFASALFLSACGGAAPATSVPVATTAATDAAIATTEPTGEATLEATTGATTEATTEATVESTSALTDTAAVTDTTAMTGTSMMTDTTAMTSTGMMTDTSAMTGTMTSEIDIVDMAENVGTFKTLIAALTAADLVETLRGEGPFTVFAPTDEAFAKLPAATLTDLLKPENKARLVKILTYHVVPGRVLAADVAGMTGATTVEGGELKIAASGSNVTINDATITQADVATKNGVIHVIDTVLMPPDM